MSTTAELQLSEELLDQLMEQWREWEAHPPNDWGYYLSQYVLGKGKDYIPRAVASLRAAAGDNLNLVDDVQEGRDYRTKLLEVADEIEAHGNENYGQLLELGTKIIDVDRRNAASLVVFAFDPILMAGQRLLELSWDQRPIIAQLIDQFQETIIGSAVVTSNIEVIAYVTFSLASNKQDRLDLRDALRLYLVSLAIWERIASVQPEVYEPKVAMTLNNLGNVLCNLRELNEARDSYSRALEIYERLASVQPEIYEADVAMTLNNLGSVLSEMRALIEARDSNSHALEIYERLALAQPEVYEPNVAMTLNNLGNVLSNLRALNQARDSYSRALEIYERLASVQPEIYKADVAMTLNNLGNVLRNLRALNEARDSYSHALEIYERLALAQPEVYEPNVAMTLNNLGNVLSNLRALNQARDAYSRALEICERLASAQPDVYEPDVATTLNNLGSVLSHLRALIEARDSFSRALEIYERLASAQPEVYEPDVAMTLNNLGNVLRELRALNEARDSYSRALEIRKRIHGVNGANYSQEIANLNSAIGKILPSARNRYHANAIRWSFRHADRFESADALDTIAGRLRRERTTRNLGQSDRFFDRAYRLGLQGLAEISTQEDTNIHRLKGRLENTFHHAIRSRLRDNLGCNAEVLGILELLRSGPRRMSVESWNRDARDVPEFARALEAVGNNGLLYIQPIFEETAFIYLQDGRLDWQIAPAEFDRAMDELYLLAHRTQRFGHRDLASSSTRILPLRHTGIRNHNQTIRNRFEEIGQRAWTILGEHAPKVVDWLTAGTCKTFLSPQGPASRWLLEFIGPLSAPIGLSHVLPRATGLFGLADCLQRSIKPGPRLIVGNPTQDLSHAGESADHVRTIAQSSDSTSQLETLIGPQALQKQVQEFACDPSLGWWFYTGHGSFSDRGGAELVLANHESLSAEEIEWIQWKNHPFVHFDCCFGGVDRYEGGGRRLSLPDAALNAGASAVLASQHSVADRDAATMSNHFYDLWLNQHLGAGEALLAARQKQYTEYEHDVLLWGLPVLFGNPDVRYPGDHNDE